MFMRISIGNLIITGGIRLMKEYCQVLFIFFFSGRLCRNRCCTFLDFQNRFDKVCRIVFRFVHRPLADSFRRNLLQNGNASAFPDFSVSFKTWNRCTSVSAIWPCSLFLYGHNIYPFFCHIFFIFISFRMVFSLFLGKGSAREIPFFSDAENVLYHFWLVIDWYLIYYVFMKCFGGQTRDKNLLSKR